MKRLLLVFAFASSLLPAAASGQVSMQIDIGLPVLPSLVVVQPGLQVVENHDEEVFFVGGWYWCRRGDAWYRARKPRASFAYVEPHYVPTRLAYLPPPGHYRHWHKHRAREDRRWWKEHDRDRRRAWKDHDARRREWQRHERPHHQGWEAKHGHGPAPARGHHAVSPAPAPARGHVPAATPNHRQGERHGGGRDDDHDRGRRHGGDDDHDRGGRHGGRDNDRGR